MPIINNDITSFSDLDQHSLDEIVDDSKKDALSTYLEVFYKIPQHLHSYIYSSTKFVFFVFCINGILI